MSKLLAIKNFLIARKKIVIPIAASILAIIVAIILIVTFAKDREAPDDTEEIADVYLLENGEFTYRIIRSDSNIGGSAAQAVRLKKALDTVTGASIAVATDFEDKDSNEDIKEILVGQTNRQASVSALAELKENEWLIRVVGNKIVVIGGSAELLEIAVQQFLLKCVGYVSDSDYTAKTEIALAGDLELRGSIDEADKDIVILKTNSDVGYIDRLMASLEGFHPKDKLRTVSITDELDGVFDTDKTALVIIAGIDKVTGQMRHKLDTYLNEDGRVLMLGGPAFESVTYLSDGKLLELDQYLQSEYAKIADINKQNAFDTEDINSHTSFERHRNKGSGVDNFDWFSYGDFGAPDSETQMKVSVKGLKTDSWAYDGFRCPVTLEATVKKNVNAVGFWARSDATEITNGIVLEVLDTNGTAWYTDISLSSEWEYYVFSESDFKYYESHGAETTLPAPTLASVKSIGFSIDNGHFSQAEGTHTYYLSSVEMYGINPTVIESITDIRLDGVAPYTQVQYPITNAASIEVFDGQVFVEERDYVIADEIISCQPGSQGTGYNKGRFFRFIPLLEVKDGEGFNAGYAAWINLYVSTRDRSSSREGAAVGYFSSCSEDFYDVNGILAVADTAKALTQNLFLIEGGTDEFTYIPADTNEIKVGCSYVDMSKYKSSELVVSLELFDGEESLAYYGTNDGWTVSGKKGEDIFSFEAVYSLDNGRPDRSVTTLSVDGEVIDRIEHSVSYWEAKPEAERKYFYVEDGYYKRDGEIINLIGVNYWPSYHIALQEYSGEFDTRAKYDPYVVRDDLERIKKLGMTSVALSLHAINAAESNNMLDIVRMCEEVGLYVDLAIRSRDDYEEEFLYFDKEDADTLVLRQHFHENDNVVAYDMCWERRVGTYNGDAFGIGRKIYDSEWQSWVISQYGSIAQAEKLWGIKAPRDADDNIIGPSDAMLNEGAASAMISAYYRFLDDIVAKEFNEFEQYLRTLDPHHLLSFRMQNAGSAAEPGECNYDFQSLASVMDFMSPEGYSVFAGEDSMIQLMFMTAYARYCSPDAPVLMKEFSANVWAGSNFAPVDNDKAKQRAAYVEEFMEHMYASEMSAFYVWWSAPSYRIKEDSDSGIFNPDGSDRLTTKVLREWIPRFTSRTERTSEYEVIVIERDDTGLGIKGMFNSVKDKLLEAYRNGKNVVFVNKQYTDENSGLFYADEVLDMPVGNTKASGSYPLKYVNGQIKSFEVYRDKGMRYAKITVCNTGHAAWRAGSVSVSSTDVSGVLVTPTVIDKELGYLEETELVVLLKRTGELELRFEIDGVEFGMAYKYKLS